MENSTRPTKILVPSLLDPAKFDAADWLGVGLMVDLNGQLPPCLGLFFQNIEPGKQMFLDWRDRLGDEDRFEELRISVIEGEIPGRESGYTVNVTSDPDGLRRRAIADGREFDFTSFALISKSHRMTPAPGSPNLRRFKAAYARHRKYTLMPMQMAGGGYEPLWDLGILKKQILFRRASDIGQDDLDFTVFPIAYADTRRKAS